VFPHLSLAMKKPIKRSSADFCLKLVNLLQNIVDFFEKDFGFIGKYFISKILFLPYILLFIIIFIISCALFIFNKLIDILNSKQILTLIACLILGIVGVSTLMFIFGLLNGIISFLIWVIGAVMYLILEYIADYRNVILPLHFTPMRDN
jgi:hypothetical protein